MTRDDIFSEVKAAAVEVLHVEPRLVKESSRFTEDLDADSLALVEFIMAVEDRLGISVPEDELDGIVTVGRAVDQIMTKLVVVSS